MDTDRCRVDRDIDRRHYRHMSMSSGCEPDGLSCCAPLVREPMGADQAASVATTLKALADPVRLRLMSLVLSHEGGEACVCDLLPAFDLSQPTISHHLKVLHDAGLLGREKRGVWVYYQARPEALSALTTLFEPAGVPVGAGA
jgi:ArsR family transcriptional regulator